MVQVIMSKPAQGLTQWFLDHVDENTVYVTTERTSIAITECISKMGKPLNFSIVELHITTPATIANALSSAKQLGGIETIIFDSLFPSIIGNAMSEFKKSKLNIIIGSEVSTKEEAELLSSIPGIELRYLEQVTEM